MKPTIIDADILKHDGKGSETIFINFFKTSTEKKKKYRSNHLKMLWEQGVLEISKKKKKKKKILEN